LQQIRKNSLGYFRAVCLDRQLRFSKTHKQQQKCDAEKNWFTYDFIHRKIEENTGQQR